MAGADRLSNVDMSCLLSSTFSFVSVTVYVIVCAATIFGNILILTSIYKYQKHFKGSLYVFIGNLAAADLFLGLWLLLFIYQVIVPEVQQLWYFCVAKPVGILISYCCSIFSLLGISFDRFMAVTFPLQHLVKTHKRKLFVGGVTGIWMISIITGCLPIILPNINQPNTTFVCRIGAIIPREFQLVSSIGLLLIVLINFTLYGFVMWKIKTTETPGNSSARKKSTKMVLMILVFALFAVCWLPFLICSFIMQTNIAPSTFQNVVCAREYLAMLGFLNSALNCVIYGLANRKFRNAFKKMLCFKCCTFLSRSLSLSTDGSKAKPTSSRIGCSVDPKQKVVIKKQLSERSFHTIVRSNTGNDISSDKITIHQEEKAA